MKYKGGQSSIKSLPGGGPQGTLLALLLFLVLINDVGFKNEENDVGAIATSKKKIRLANEIHLKYVDDLTIAEAVKLKDDMTNFQSESKVFNQLLETQSYCEQNDMKINLSKTKMMVFNQSKTKSLNPNFRLGGEEIELISEVKLLGLHISNDMKWKTNTYNMIRKPSKRLWVLRRLKKLGADSTSLIEVYLKQIRCILEFGAPAWQGSLTANEKADIERVQRCALHIILGKHYVSYKTALESFNLENLEVRRVRLCLKFALRAEVHPKFRNWFQKVTKAYNTRSSVRYKTVYANHSRYANSPLAYLTRLLNLHYNTL